VAIGALAIELFAILLVGRAVGVLMALALLALTALAGMRLIGLSGLSLGRAMQATSQHEFPIELRRSLFLFLSGLLLISPGFASDVLALVLLIPAVQALIAGRLRGFVSTTTAAADPWLHPSQDGPVIDGEAVEIIPPDHRMTRGDRPS
jgi:UPF0716 protein FxsA